MSSFTSSASKLRDEAEEAIRMCNAIRSLPASWAYRQAKRVLILLDALEEIAEGAGQEAESAEEAIKQAEEV